MKKKESKTITITITDIDDLHKVMEALDKLFRTILVNFNDTGNFHALDCVSKDFFDYLRIVLLSLGYTNEELNIQNREEE